MDVCALGEAWLTTPPVKYCLIESITITTDDLPNPFADHILPLAYRDDGVLHALLGLSACHLYTSKRNTSAECSNTALRHRVAAIRTLGSLLEQEGVSQLTHAQEESVLATVLLLIFHDVSRASAAQPDLILTGSADMRDRRLVLWSPPDWCFVSLFTHSQLHWSRTTIEGDHLLCLGADMVSVGPVSHWTHALCFLHRNATNTPLTQA